MKRFSILFYFLLVCFSFMVLLSCADNTELLKEINSVENTLVKNFNSKINYLALGDSYSVGEGLINKANWPTRLSDSLLEERDEVSYKIIGETGFSTADLKRTVESTNFESTYNLISIQIGVNDQFRGENIESFRSDFYDLISKIKMERATSNALIFVVSIPDWGSTPFGNDWDQAKITKEINDFNNVLRDICVVNNFTYVDITTVSRTSPFDWSLVTSDGLHPSEKMYGFWLNEIVPAVKNLLSN